MRLLHLALLLAAIILIAASTAELHQLLLAVPDVTVCDEMYHTVECP